MQQVPKTKDLHAFPPGCRTGPFQPYAQFSEIPGEIHSLQCINGIEGYPANPIPLQVSRVDLLLLEAQTDEQPHILPALPERRKGDDAVKPVEKILAERGVS